jgi:hypothetical protein
MEMDPATYARLTDIERYVTTEFDPEPATAGREAGIEPRRRSAFQAWRAIFGLERKGSHGSVEPARASDGRVDARANPADR